MIAKIISHSTRSPQLGFIRAARFAVLPPTTEKGPKSTFYESAVAVSGRMETAPAPQ